MIVSTVGLGMLRSNNVKVSTAWVRKFSVSSVCNKFCQIQVGKISVNRIRMCKMSVCTIRMGMMIISTVRLRTL